MLYWPKIDPICAMDSEGFMMSVLVQSAYICPYNHMEWRT